VTVTVQAPQPQPQPQPQSQSQPAPKKVATCPKKNAVKSRMSPVGKKNAKHAKGKTKPVAAKKTRKSAQLEAICKKQSSKPTKSHTQKAGKHAHSTTKQKQQAKKHKTKQRRQATWPALDLPEQMTLRAPIAAVGGDRCLVR
jgi:hypothetical protein